MTVGLHHINTYHSLFGSHEYNGVVCPSGTHKYLCVSKYNSLFDQSVYSTVHHHSTSGIQSPFESFFHCATYVISFVTLFVSSGLHHINTYHSLFGSHEYHGDACPFGTQKYLCVSKYNSLFDQSVYSTVHQSFFHCATYVISFVTLFVSSGLHHINTYHSLFGSHEYHGDACPSGTHKYLSVSKYNSLFDQSVYSTVHQSFFHCATYVISFVTLFVSSGLHHINTYHSLFGSHEYHGDACPSGTHKYLSVSKYNSLFDQSVYSTVHHIQELE